MKKLCLVIPSLTAGGAERVMTILANNFAERKNIEVHLILLVKGDVFYNLHDNITLYEPDFNYKDFSRIIFSFKTFRYLRKKLMKIRPKSVLSFGGRYNSLMLLSSVGLGIKTFISDRSRPGINYGFVQNIINLWLYRLASGIIAQTSQAEKYFSDKINHKNIRVIGNPIPCLHSNAEREYIILNVGRFIYTKKQEDLINIFYILLSEIGSSWKLVFLGDGKRLEHCKELVNRYKISDRVFFKGNVKDIESYYQSASIFAFTSISEGFPNALGEALSAGCACISYDFVAGARDMILDGENGYLIKEGDMELFQEKLLKLTFDENLRVDFGNRSKLLMKKFNISSICDDYMNFLFSKC